jgi:DNA-binding LacI/PurR family transcriptional regulator
MIGQSEIAYRASNFPPRVRAAAAARAAARGVRHSFAAAGATATEPGVVRAATASALDEGATAFALHAAEDAHEVVLETIAERGLVVGRDVSLVSVASVFDATRLSTPLDTIPLVPAVSCDAAVDLAIARLQDASRAPVLHLIPPEYRAAGSVAPVPA